MSNKLRLKVREDGPEFVLVVQKCNPGAPWTDVETFRGEDKAAVTRIVYEKYPKARYR